MAEPFIATSLLDDQAQVHTSPSDDVFDRFSSPDAGRSTRQALAIEELGHLGEGMLGEFVPDAADDRRLRRDDHELAGMDELVIGVPKAAIAERVVPSMSTLFKEVALDSGHPLRVEIALELPGEAELTEHIASIRSIKACPWHRGHKQGDLLTLEFVMEVQHQAGIAGQATQVVHDDRTGLACGKDS